MKLCIISEDTATIEVKYYHHDSDYVDYDPERADQIADASGIRISRNKELTLVALAKDDHYKEIVGAVWTAFEADHDYEEETYRYDFDVVVDPKMRSNGLTSARIGPMLIDAALDDYKVRAVEVARSYIRVWVVNPKLAKWLEAYRGFKTEDGGDWHRSAPFMVRY